MTDAEIQEALRSFWTKALFAVETERSRPERRTALLEQLIKVKSAAYELHGEYEKQKGGS